MKSVLIGITAFTAGLLVAFSPLLAASVEQDGTEAQIAARDLESPFGDARAPSYCPPLALTCGDALMWASRERRQLPERFETLGALRESLEQRRDGGGPRGGLFRD